MLGRKLRFGMIGGGKGAFIGAVHRIAAQMDGQAELVAGAFSSDPRRSLESGVELGIGAARTYGSYAEMVSAEVEKSRAERLDFVSIVTPNHEHFPAAKMCLEAGFNVVCDKPMTLTVAEAEELRKVVLRSRKVFVLTHNYAGNAMVKQARALVRTGSVGAVRKVVVEYSQGWLARPIEGMGQKQASWRTDPGRSGAAGCLGDIGTHAEHLARYVTGVRVSELCAELTTFVPGRRLDDDGNVLLRFEGGARGVLHASQIAIGKENDLRLRVHGENASLEWRQEEPDTLVVQPLDEPAQLWRRGNPYVASEARAVTRIPVGHPEGYLEAFANLYREAFRGIAAEVTGGPVPEDLDVPTVEDGVLGMRFIDATVRSSREGGRWIAL